MEIDEVPRLLVWTDTDFQELLIQIFDGIPNYILEDNADQFVQLASLGGFRVGVIAPHPHKDVGYIDNCELVEMMSAKATEFFPIYVFDNGTILKHHVGDSVLKNPHVHFVSSDDWQDANIWAEIKRIASTPNGLERGLPDFVMSGLDFVVTGRNDPNITVMFDFPQHVAPYCRAYLEFFTQFLRNIGGIEATSDTSTVASSVLFSVTPSDPNEALSKIQEALAVYLQLPTVGLSVIPSNDIQTIEFQQLAYTVDQLRIQLAMENSKSRMKDVLLLSQERTIEAYEIAVRSQQPQLPVPQVEPTVMIDSVKAVSGQKPDEEYIDKFGIVSLKSVEWGPVRFNPQNALKALREKLHKRD